MKKIHFLVLLGIWAGSIQIAFAQCPMTDTQTAAVSKANGKLKSMILNSNDAFADIQFEAIFFLNQTVATREQFIPFFLPVVNKIRDGSIRIDSKRFTFPLKRLVATLPLCIIPQLLELNIVDSAELNSSVGGVGSITVGN